MYSNWIDKAFMKNVHMYFIVPVDCSNLIASGIQAKKAKRILKIDNVTKTEVNF